MYSQADYEALVRSILTYAGVARADELVDLEKRVVDDVETDQGTALPGMYRSFLSVAGVGAGRLWVGTDAFYPSILGLKRAANDLLAENSASFRVPSSAVVILMHSGYQFVFLDGDGDDPPVYMCV